MYINTSKLFPLISLSDYKTRYAKGKVQINVLRIIVPSHSDFLDSVHTVLEKGLLHTSKTDSFKFLVL